MAPSPRSSLAQEQDSAIPVRLQKYSPIDEPCPRAQLPPPPLSTSLSPTKPRPTTLWQIDEVRNPLLALPVRPGKRLIVLITHPAEYRVPETHHKPSQPLFRRNRYSPLPQSEDLPHRRYCPHPAWPQRSTVRGSRDKTHALSAVAEPKLLPQLVLPQSEE